MLCLCLLRYISPHNLIIHSRQAAARLGGGWDLAGEGGACGLCRALAGRNGGTGDGAWWWRGLLVCAERAPLALTDLGTGDGVMDGYQAHRRLVRAAARSRAFLSASSSATNGLDRADGSLVLCADNLNRCCFLSVHSCIATLLCCNDSSVLRTTFSGATTTTGIRGLLVGMR